MQKIIVLGTGIASVVENFNTSFILENNNKEYLLVDTGGGNGILRQFFSYEDLFLDPIYIHGLRMYM